jgi:glycerol-3-phosphate O-acyltransferase
VAEGTVTDRKAFVKYAMETGRAEFHAGRIGAAESLAKTTLENAVAYLLDQKYLVEEDKKLKLGPAGTEPGTREQLASDIRSYLQRA